ncbi:MAG: hypothetical protein HFF09_02255 [Oscillospiraceae bacterium]|nr:hypothetical protein [Oscillospiraceae bacterium]
MHPNRPDLLLTSPPAQLQAASAFGLPIGHMAYRVGPGGHLLRSGIPVSARGGLMVVDDVSLDGRGDSAVFCREVIRECTARHFNGVICDFERNPCSLTSAIAEELGGVLTRRGWPLYLPERYARFSTNARVVVSSALSGGSLRRRLEDAVQQYGADRLTLGVQRIAEDFFLPSPSGGGTPLSREELHRRMEERSPSVFFSHELCAHYFTYMSHQNGAHFVLFDDASSIRKKLSIARELGIRWAILAYPDVDDLLPALLA